MLTVDRAMNDWRDLPSVEEICDNVIEIISECAPGTDIYTGEFQLRCDRLSSPLFSSHG
jgi:hypothetical protein